MRWFFNALLFLLTRVCLTDGVRPTDDTDTKALLNLQLFDSQKYPLAVCNDGSIGGYYYTPAIDSNKKDWFLIYLPGGAQCYDEASCEIRWQSSPQLMSSTKFSQTINKGGIFDTDEKKSPLWGVNKIILGYCSSDGYMGNIAASESTWGWHFRGQALVSAMIQELIANHNLSGQSTVVLGGGSAGARGMMTMLDDIIGNKLPQGSRAVGFLDSPYYIDIPPYTPSFQGFQYQEEQKYLHYNTTGVLSEACVDYYHNDASQLWKCQYGQYRMPFVQSPYLLIGSQYDSYQLSLDTASDPTHYTTEVNAYADKFAQMTMDSMQSLINVKRSPDALENTYGYFSWTCYNHDVSEGGDFSNQLNNENISERDALQQYLENDPFVIAPLLSKAPHNVENVHVKSSKVLTWFDTCVGVNCGIHCK